MTFNSADGFTLDKLRANRDNLLNVPNPALEIYKLDFINPDVTQQRDDYRNLNEQYQKAGISAMNRPTGNEPVYGLSKPDMNMFLNNTYSLIKSGTDVYSQTKVLDVIDDRYLYKNTFLMPEPDYMNVYLGSPNG